MPVPWGMAHSQTLHCSFQAESDVLQPADAQVLHAGCSAGSALVALPVLHGGACGVITSHCACRLQRGVGGYDAACKTLEQLPKRRTAMRIQTWTWTWTPP